MTAQKQTNKKRTAKTPRASAAESQAADPAKVAESSPADKPLTWRERRAATKAVRHKTRLARKAKSAARKAERAADDSARAANRATRQAHRARAAAQNAGAANLDAQTLPGIQVRGKKRTLQEAGQGIMQSAFKGAVEGALAGAIQQIHELAPNHKPEPLPELAVSDEEVNDEEVNDEEVNDEKDSDK